MSINGRVMGAAGLAAAIAIGATGSVAAQDRNDGPPLLLINGETRVGSVRFRFVSGRTVEPEQLQTRMALKGPEGGLLRKIVGWLPFVSKPVLPRFSPIELQKDRTRVLRFLEREGFPHADVRYRVRLDTTANTVRVVFAIDEGSPRRLGSLQFTRGDDRRPEWPATLAGSWERFANRENGRHGDRLSETLETQVRSETLEWMRSHGYPFADLALTVQVDSALDVGNVVVRLDPGPRARVGEIRVEGNEALSDNTIRRELPFHPGDPFRSRQLADGRRQLAELDLIRVALVDVAPGQPRDSTADVRVHVEEGATKLIEGQVGYISEAGISGSTTWSHRNFLGGARTLSASLQAETGLLGTADGPQRRYGGSVTLRQPYLGHRLVSGLFTPSIEYRDDLRDRSVRVGAEATALWTRGPVRNVSVSYSLSQRWILQSRGGALVGAQNLLDLLRALDTLGTSVRTGVLSLGASWGRLDNPVNPRNGWVARGGADLAGPAPLSSVSYGRLTASFYGLVSFGRAGLVTRFSVGRLYPFGRSVPGAGNELDGLLRLRDAVFTAGGTGDVRGWSTGLLGPKVPDFEVKVQGDSIRLVSAGRYVPLGGLARWTGSVELQLPVPYLPQHRVFGFLDGGRVWVPDDRFNPGGTGAEDQKAFFATGAGVELRTPAGPLRIALAYQLNPSLLDVRDPDKVVRALLLGQPVTSVPEQSGRRWKLHLSIGRPF